jgi:hypothetical protein
MDLAQPVIALFPMSTLELEELMKLTLFLTSILCFWCLT